MYQLRHIIGDTNTSQGKSNLKPHQLYLGRKSGKRQSGKGFVLKTEIEKTQVLGERIQSSMKRIQRILCIWKLWGNWAFLHLSHSLYKQWITFLHTYYFSPFLPISITVREETLSLERAEIHSVGDRCYMHKLEQLNLPITFIISPYSRESGGETAWKADYITLPTIRDFWQ